MNATKQYEFIDNIFIRPGYGTFGYSDGEAAEDYLLTRIRQTADVSTGSAGLAAATRDPEVMKRYSGGTPIPDAYHRAVSRRAVAESTGLARETTRRKLSRLIEQGRLIEDERGGVRGRYALLADPDNLAFARDIVQEFLRTAERLERISPADAARGDER